MFKHLAIVAIVTISVSAMESENRKKPISFFGMDKWDIVVNFPNQNESKLTLEDRIAIRNFYFPDVVVQTEQNLARAVEYFHQLQAQTLPNQYIFARACTYWAQRAHSDLPCFIPLLKSYTKRVLYQAFIIHRKKRIAVDRTADELKLAVAYVNNEITRNPYAFEEWEMAKYMLVAYDTTMAQLKEKSGKMERI